MAKLSAYNRWEVDRVIVTLSNSKDNGPVRITFALMSDGWVLRKRGTGPWTRFERVPGIKGRGPKLLHGGFPEGSPERAYSDAVIGLIRRAACRMREAFAASGFRVV